MLTVAPGRARVALMAVLLAAAMPVRLFQSLPVVSSVSILDLLLIAAGVTLFMDLAFRPIDVGYRELFLLLSIPLIFATASLTWSEDRDATLRAVLIYAESLIAYLFVVRELSGLAPTRIITYIKRYSYLLIIPGVLLLLNVPGFEPRTDAAPSSGDYLRYFTRFSHPILGSSNNLATLLAFFAPILLYWGHTRKDRKATTAAFVSLIAIVLTQSRGILLAFAIAGLLYAPLAVRQPAAVRGLGAKIVATVVVGIAAFGIYYGLNSSTREFFKDRLTLTTVTERSELISLSLSSIASKPLAGYGAGVAPEVDVVTSPGQVTNLDLFSDLPVQRTGGGQLDVHNTFLQQAVYFGIPAALLISLALCGTAGVFLARRRSIALAGVIGYALMVQLVSFVFEASLEGTVLRVLFYLSVGLAAGLLRSVEQEPEAAGTDASH